MLRHVVLFAFAPTAGPSAVAGVCEHFARLPQEIEFIRGFEWGTNVSPEQINYGYTHCFVLTFAGDADRDAYLVHPAHQAFVAAANPVLASALVVDYWAQGGA
jgi:hypothetical protein